MDDTIRTQMKSMIKKLKDWDYHYYTLDSPKVSDDEYDQLYDRLVQLEQSSGIVEPDSPTQRIGGEVLKKFKKHTHLLPLYSLNKCKTYGELAEWIERTTKLIGQYNATSDQPLPEMEYCLEYKFDGLTISLTYDQGYLVTAATRGTGTVGEEILSQVKTIPSIPLSITYPKKVEIQGEGLMPLSALEKYNQEHEITLKNARNAAAGALRNLNPKITRERELIAYFYQVGYTEEPLFQTQEEITAFLKENRLPVCPYSITVQSFSQIKEQIEWVKQERNKLDILTDGVVIKINDLRTRDVLGYTNKFPRWAIAFKFEAEEYSTILKDVVWNVGRTGKVTPTAILEPVNIGGVTVQRATLNNYEDMLRKGIRRHSRVLIRRSNDVIPEILGTLEDHSLETQAVEMPSHCPFCHSELYQNGVHFFCPNSISCKPQLISRIVHFASRDAMNIEGLSKQTAIQLMDKLQVTNLSQLYDITKDDLLRLDGYKEKKSTNLIQALEKSKQVQLPAFLYALGIPNVGKKTSSDLSDRYASLEQLMAATEEELLQIEEIGPIIAHSIYDFFHDPEIKKGIDTLQAKGITILSAKRKTNGQSPLKGKRIVITGTLSQYTRKELEDILSQNGAKLGSSVSANTDYVIVGENPGSKFDKARELNISIVREEDLEDFLRQI